MTEQSARDDAVSYASQTKRPRFKESTESVGDASRIGSLPSTSAAHFEEETLSSNSNVDDDELQALIDQEFEELLSEERTVKNESVGQSAILSDETSSIGTSQSTSTALEEPKPDEYLYCDECATWVVGSCVLHERTIIEAVPVGEEEQEPPLPEGLRYNNESTAVFATQDFPKGTLFGPVEGDFVERESCVSLKTLQYLWEIRLYNGRSKYLLQSSSPKCTWPIRVAFTDDYKRQNLIAIQYTEDVYYKSIRPIKEGDELLVAHGYGLPLTKEIPFNTLLGSNFDGNKRAYHCGDCYGYFFSERKLNDHKKSARHVFDPEHCCTRCPFVAINARALTMHMWRIHQQPIGTARSFNCSECGRTFGRKHHLKRHIETMHGQEVKCPRCPKMYKNDWAMASHAERVHGIEVMEKAFACPTCDRKFYGYQQMAMHRLECTDEARKEKKRQYSREHNERKRKNAMPPPAPKVTPTERPISFQCRFCEAVYQKPQSRSRHEHKKHREQAEELQLRKELAMRPPDIYQQECVQCGKRFKTITDLNLHMKRHEGRYDYKCSYENCDSAYISMAELRKHLKNVHEKKQAETEATESKAEEISNNERSVVID